MNSITANNPQTGLRWLLLLITAAIAPLAAADRQLPLWELGAGVIATSQPHYLGADDSRAYVLPVPYFKYRGDILRADRGGVRARLLETERFSLGVSGGGSFPVDSEDNDARRGMPDLDVRAEVGPNLRWDLVDNDALHLQFQVPARAAFSFGDENGDYQGWTTNPRLVATMPQGEWTYSSTFGAIVSNDDYYAYTYDVAPEFALPDRPTYRSESGYGGLRFGFGMARYFDNVYVSAQLRYFNTDGAKNEASPLFRRDHNFSASINVSWVLRRSKRMVTVEDDQL